MSAGAAHSTFNKLTGGAVATGPEFGTNEIAPTDHGFADNDVVTYYDNGVTDPAELANGQTYKVKIATPTPNSFTLCLLSDVTTITPIAAGSGTGAVFFKQPGAVFLTGPVITADANTLVSAGHGLAAVSFVRVFLNIQAAFSELATGEVYEVKTAATDKFTLEKAAGDNTLTIADVYGAPGHLFVPVLGAKYTTGVTTTNTAPLTAHGFVAGDLVQYFKSLAAGIAGGE